MTLSTDDVTTKFPAPVLDSEEASPSSIEPEYDFYNPKLDRIEDLVEYEKGGYHPVSLGDTFKNGRYSIVHKLGHGGSSTVWMARVSDAARYVALKIRCAQMSDEICDIKILDYLKIKDSSHAGRQYVSFLIDHFRIEGPNGSHSCLVSEVLGPSLSTLGAAGKQLRGSVSRKIARQFVQAVSYLHSEDVCHGDLTAANITFKVANFDSWTKEELSSRLGKPETEAIRTVSGNPVPPNAPAYVVQPVSFADKDAEWLQEDIRLIDFGIAFVTKEPPHDPGTPPSFTAPEAWFEMAAGKSTDLWALGCTLYAMRSGVTLIQLPWGGTPLEVISEISSFLGPLPERWDRLWFDEEGMPQPREEIVGDESPPAWRSETEEQTQTLQDIVAHISDEYHGPPRAEDNVERKKLPIELEIEAEGGKVIYPPEKPKQRISANEAQDLADLLGKVLRWEPNDRASAQELLGHPWFERSYLDARTADNAHTLFQS